MEGGSSVTNSSLCVWGGGGGSREVAPYAGALGNIFDCK